MLTHKLAKAILRSPEFGEMKVESNVRWVKKIVRTWPMCQEKQTKIDIYVDGQIVESCDISWVRKCANG